MRAPLMRPDLLPDDTPMDVEACETPQLLNPPHIGRVLWTADDLVVSDPDWTLLTHPAA